MHAEMNLLLETCGNRLNRIHSISIFFVENEFQIGFVFIRPLFVRTTCLIGKSWPRRRIRLRWMRELLTHVGRWPGLNYWPIHFWDWHQLNGQNDEWMCVVLWWKYLKIERTCLLHLTAFVITNGDGNDIFSTCLRESFQLFDNLFAEWCILNEIDSSCIRWRNEFTASEIDFFWS